MGTRERRAREKEGLREEILAAARALFVQYGFENVSIRKIADKIEYSPGTIYLYFKDKEQIFRTLCEQSFGSLRARMDAICKDNCEPMDKLRRAGRAYIDFALQNPQHYTLTFLRPTESVWPVNSAHEPAVGDSCYHLFHSMVHQAVTAGLTRSQDVHELTQSLWACMHGVASLLIVKKDFPFIEQTRLIDSVVEIVTEGIQKP